MLPKYYEFSCPVKILCGRKAMPNIPYEMTQLRSSRAMIVTDRGIIGAKLIKHIEAAFNDSDREIGHTYSEVPVDSSNRTANEVARLYREHGCDCFIAVGGGSVIDTAKAANIVVSEGTEDLLDMQGVDRITAHMQPLIAVPTTAGTGSEVTNVAVVRHEESGTKMAFMSNRLFPAVAVVDPVMITTMPPKITAATGMDALTHAIEAFYCLQKNPVSDAYSAAAIRLIKDNLVKTVEDGKDADARLAMANGALLAGISFTNAMVGMVHALAHACGGVAHIPHGVANAILLPFGMRYNIEKVPEHLAELADILGLSTAGLDTRAKAQKAADWVNDLNATLNRLCGLPITLKDAGVRRDQLEDIARASINDGALTYNPEEMTYEESLKVLEQAY